MDFTLKYSGTREQCIRVYIRQFSSSIFASTILRGLAISEYGYGYSLRSRRNFHSLALPLVQYNESGKRESAVSCYGSYLGADSQLFAKNIISRECLFALLNPIEENEDISSGSSTISQYQ